jgi:hypothetical protein
LPNETFKKLKLGVLQMELIFYGIIFILKDLLKNFSQPTPLEKKS